MSIDTVFQATCCISSCCAASNNPTARYLVLHLKCYVATVRDRGREASPKRQRLRRQRNKRPRATQGGEHAAVHQMYHHILTHTHTHTHAAWCFKKRNRSMFVCFFVRLLLRRATKCKRKPPAMLTDKRPPCASRHGIPPPNLLRVSSEGHLS